jgi:hypothetical protein
MSEDEVLATLKRIEARLEKVEMITDPQWVYALGMTAAVGSVGLSASSPLGALIVLFLGLLLMLYASFRRGRRTN